MNKYPERRFVERMKTEYPKGTLICVDNMADDPHPVKAGTKGTVICVDDAGTVHCSFEDGRQLGLIPQIDSFHKIQ